MHKLNTDDLLAFKSNADSRKERHEEDCLIILLNLVFLLFQMQSQEEVVFVFLVFFCDKTFSLLFCLFICLTRVTITEEGQGQSQGYKLILEPQGKREDE